MILAGLGVLIGLLLIVGLAPQGSIVDGSALVLLGCSRLID